MPSIIVMLPVLKNCLDPCDPFFPRNAFDHFGPPGRPDPLQPRVLFVLVCYQTALWRTLCYDCIAFSIFDEFEWSLYH